MFYVFIKSELYIYKKQMIYLFYCAKQKEIIGFLHNEGCDISLLCLLKWKHVYTLEFPLLAVRKQNGKKTQAIDSKNKQCVLA